MARIPLIKRKKMIVACAVTFYSMMLMMMELLVEFIDHVCSVMSLKVERPIIYTFDRSSHERVYARILNLRPMIEGSDVACLDNLRMDRACFNRLCDMLRDVGKLKGNKNTTLQEMVALFLFTLSHHTKNRRTQIHFRRSGETVSRHFHAVLCAVIRCHRNLLKRPHPVTDNSQDERWKWFKNCLGALDGTHIKLRVSEEEKSRYRNRKKEITTNVLGACTQQLQFTYILPGWEGSAHDNIVLRDALSRPNPLIILQGMYYLCDAGYMNCEGCLTPFRGEKYHLSTWKRGAQPTSAKEYFNMKHSQARNVIERCFGMLKMRWGILRCATWYDKKTFGRIIMACALLHNLIREYMKDDPLDTFLNDGEDQPEDQPTIDELESSDEWNTFRNDLATEMFESWLQTRNS